MAFGILSRVRQLFAVRRAGVVQLRAGNLKTYLMSSGPRQVVWWTCCTDGGQYQRFLDTAGAAILIVLRGRRWDTTTRRLYCSTVCDHGKPSAWATRRTGDFAYAV